MGNKQIKVLFIENNHGDFQLIESLLRKGGDNSSFLVERAERLSAGLKRLNEYNADVVLLNPNLPDSSGFDTFKNIYNYMPEKPILVLSDKEDDNFASKALKGGAQDYLIKKEITAGMARSIRHAIDRQQMLVELRHTTLIDELTGVYNRRGFFTLGKQQLKLYDRYMDKKMIYVFFADLDHFKWINDSFGHHIGDQALRDAAGILLNTFRDSDIVARIGGDEFAVLALGTRDISKEVIINRFLEKLDEFNSMEIRDFELSVSIGAVQYNPDNYNSISELLFEADTEMYESKNNKKMADCR